MEYNKNGIKDQILKIHENFYKLNRHTKNPFIINIISAGAMTETSLWDFLITPDRIFEDEKISFKANLRDYVAFFKTSVQSRKRGSISHLLEEERKERELLVQHYGARTYHADIEYYTSSSKEGSGYPVGRRCSKERFYTFHKHNVAPYPQELKPIEKILTDEGLFGAPSDYMLHVYATSDDRNNRPYPKYYTLYGEKQKDVKGRNCEVGLDAFIKAEEPEFINAKAGHMKYLLEGNYYDRLVLMTSLATGRNALSLVKKRLKSVD